MDGDEERLEKLKKLSNRELEVLELVCQRHTYKEIGELLFIAEGTVQFHIGNIYQKLGIAELAKAAAELKATLEMLATTQEALRNAKAEIDRLKN